ncbi:PLP-dependent aminotransferase family protein [Hymenobacter sp. B81]|uniref:PLP-dependent aminotransferase family protein n=1 Tax=Hymenobacter sp. B81 TaxID=3344878 RepID=UPI0037DC91E3
MKPELLYVRIATALEQQIRSGVLPAGAKLPSLRAVQQLHGVSLNTAKQAYLELERHFLIEARPQSGFYVRRAAARPLALPAPSAPPIQAAPEPVEALIARMYRTLEDPSLTQLSMAVPDAALLPVAKLRKSVATALRTASAGGTGYDTLAGSERLRQQVARWAFTWSGTLQPDDLVTTAGAMNALTFSLQAVTQPGDVVAVESPVYVWALQLIRSLGLQALELPTHPVTGIDLDALRLALPRIQACLLIPNFSNPLGSCMPDAHKQAVVQLLASREIPLIEDDVYGELYYGDRRPRPCKAFDEQGLVLWCSSVSKTVAPGYRVGWVAPGRFKEQVLRCKLLQSLAAPSLHQEAIAEFLAHGRYEQHLRGLRRTLHANSRACQQVLATHFPATTRVTRPTGGFTLWAELDERVDTQRLFDAALRQRIIIAPGRLFTQHDQFNNCLRLSYGLPWSTTVEDKLRRLGLLVQEQLDGHSA